MLGRMQLALLVLTTLAVAQLGAPVSVSEELEQQAIARIQQLLNDNRNNPPGSGVQHAAAKLVRLSFHDCMVKCDGCLNMNNTDNRGLGPMYNLINDIYDNEGYGDSEMSRADFIALAGITAVYDAADRQNCTAIGMPEGCTPPRPTLTPRYGRQDCNTSPTTTELIEFPNPHGDLAHVMSIFGQGGMGMMPRQVVALLGAHSLGDTNTDNSGFIGPWAPPPDVLSNGFFRQLVNPTIGENWFQVAVNASDSPVFPTPRYQWVTRNLTTMGGPMMGGPMMGGPPRLAPPPLMMLNTDMSLFREIQPNPDGSESNPACSSNADDCPSAMTAEYVQEFAMNNSAWHEAFGPAFQMLIENGYELNDLVEAIAPTVATSTSPSPTPSGASTIVAQLFIIASAVVTIPLLNQLCSF